MFTITPIGKKMMQMQEELAKYYHYEKQPDEEAEKNMQCYLSNLPEEFKAKITLPQPNPFTGKSKPGYEISGQNIHLYSKAGTLIADKYDRIVIGHYGAFLEIADKDIHHSNLICQRGQEYRISNPDYSSRVKYYWMTTKDHSGCKLYLQQRTVHYADYKVGKWYISPYEVCDENERKSFEYSSPLYKAGTQIFIQEHHLISLPTPLEIISSDEIHKEDKTMDHKFYKAAATQITDDGKNTGKSVFVPEFNSLKDAERFAREHLLSDLSIIEIREYETSKTNVIAFDMPQDTGKQVFRDVSGIKVRVIDEFKKAHEKYDDWEDTMSYMIDCIKSPSSSFHDEADFDYLYSAIDLLTDEEVNEILSFDGSDEYIKCENGSLVPVNEREME